MSAVPSEASLVTLSPSDTSVPASAGGWGWHSAAEVGSDSRVGSWVLLACRPHPRGMGERGGWLGPGGCWVDQGGG